MKIILHPFVFVILAVLGVVGGFIANKNNRSPYLWFSLIFLFGLPALIILLYITNYKNNNGLLRKTLRKKKSLSEIDLFFLKNKHKDKLWYYLDEKGNQQGPVSLNLLITKWKTKTNPIDKKTYVWNESLQNWKMLKEFFPFDKTNKEISSKK